MPDMQASDFWALLLLALRQECGGQIRITPIRRAAWPVCRMSQEKA